MTQITDFGFQQEEEIGRSIISHTKYRLKDRESIIAKMVKKKRETHRGKCVYIHQRSGRNSGNLPVSRMIFIVCGILFYQIPGISIVKEKDFVKKPKNSGYQSLHVIVQFTDGKK